MDKYYVFLLDNRIVQISSWLVESDEYIKPTVTCTDKHVEGALLIEDPTPGSSLDISQEDASLLIEKQEKLPLTFNSEMYDALGEKLNLETHIITENGEQK